MADIREALVALLTEHILDEGANECSCEEWEHWEDPYLERIDSYGKHVADAILAEFDVTPPTVKPSVEDVARAILGYRPEDLEFPTDLDHSRWGGALDQARAVLALFEKGGGRG